MVFWIWGGCCCWNWRDRWDWLATLSMLMMKVQSDDSDLQTGVLTVGHHCLLLFISQPDKCMGICYWSFRKLFVRTRSTLIVSNLNAMKKTEWLTDFNHDEKDLSWPLDSRLLILDETVIPPTVLFLDLGHCSCATVKVKVQLQYVSRIISTCTDSMFLAVLLQVQRKHAYWFLMT